MKFLDYGVGVLTGLLIGGLAVLFGMSLHYEAGLAFLRSNAKELIGSGATLFAASLAWYAVMRQIKEQRDAEERVKAAKLAAAKAMLVTALGATKNAAKMAIDAHAKQDSAFKKLDIWKRQHPTIPITAENQLWIRDCIEHADPDSASRLAKLLHLYAQAVSELDRHPNGVKGYWVFGFKRWAVILRLTEDCLDYAQGHVKSIPPIITRRDFGSLIGKEPFFDKSPELKELTEMRRAADELEQANNPEMA